MADHRVAHQSRSRARHPEMHATTKRNQARLVHELLSLINSIAGNEACADCGRLAPGWVSVIRPKAVHADEVRQATTLVISILAEYTSLTQRHLPLHEMREYPSKTWNTRLESKKSKS